MDCEFCRIVAGDERAHVLYENDETIAILDENPAVTGHSLVLPRSHDDDVLTSTDSTTTDVFRTARLVATGLEEALGPVGFSVFHTTGSLVGTVDHAHVHLLPRFEDDDVSLSLGRETLPDREGTELASKIRTALEEQS
ncbi:histidine triad (HIT) family protein [Natronobacterium gregoryi]|uniref:HIT family hydrolase, diadenosine tetraphosphate hydrolase n=3 Tax=Natronobacterium gregoryi TaxID=44930 RepID=L0AJE8_NATGS|nr:HIT family hydrolase, diadenosine tetraphosphate hydrolase [Natronobacterium gregoryi SP2]ELY70595.1 histidine triad protein [Natronobacterium gregoryi SP2]PLK20771.1 HIT family protein [Natronobacterium gregoryi SP2]SFJ07456.1 histidine triad (HIT) family protein [Natronobacterium gregoryi]